MTLFELWLIALMVDVFGLSVITYLYYGWDKRQAKRGRERIPEKRLHLLAVLGGWPGGLLGQWRLRHKSSKVSFQIVFLLTVMGHFIWAGAVTALLYLYAS